MKTKEVFNDVEYITLSDLVNISTKIKIKVLISLVVVLFSIGFTLFKVVQSYQLRKMAVAISKPFDVTIEPDVIKKYVTNKTIKKKLD